MHSWLCLLCEGPDVHYVSGFVGVCLMQYFYRRDSENAFVLLTRLLNRNVVFTGTLSRLLRVTDVVEMAVKVSYVRV